MFGLKEEIIAAACALALLAVAGLMWRLHWLNAEVDRQKANAATSHANWQAEHQVREALVAAREVDAQLVAEKAAEADTLRRAAKAKKDTIQGVYNASPTARAWRDTPIPADLLAGLHQPASRDPARDHRPDPAGRVPAAR